MSRSHDRVLVTHHVDLEQRQAEIATAAKPHHAMLIEGARLNRSERGIGNSVLYLIEIGVVISCHDKASALEQGADKLGDPAAWDFLFFIMPLDYYEENHGKQMRAHPDSRCIPLE